MLRIGDELEKPYRPSTVPNDAKVRKIVENVEMEAAYLCHLQLQSQSQTESQS